MNSLKKFFIKIFLIFFINILFYNTLFAGCCNSCCCNKNHKTDKKFDISSEKIALTKDFKFINCSFTQKNNICWYASPLLALLNCPVFQEFIRNTEVNDPKKNYLKIVKKILSHIEKKQGYYREDLQPYYQEVLKDIEINDKSFWKYLTTESNGRKRVLSEEGVACTCRECSKYLLKDLSGCYTENGFFFFNHVLKKNYFETNEIAVDRILEFIDKFSKNYCFYSMVVNKVLNNAVENYCTNNKITDNIELVEDENYHISLKFDDNYVRDTILSARLYILGDEDIIKDIKQYNLRSSSGFRKLGIDYDCFFYEDIFKKALETIENVKKEFLNNYDLQLNSIVFEDIKGGGHYFTVSRDESGKFYDLSTTYDNELDKTELREFDFWNNFDNFLFTLPRNNLENKVKKSVNRPCMVVVTVKRK